MIIGRVKGLIKSKSLKLDMYSNYDHNDCKSKYNSLVYLLCHHINEQDKSFLGYGRDLEKIFTKNKEALLLYLFVIKSILSNQQLSDAIINIKDFSFIRDLRGNLNLNDVEGKKIILNQIRNAFAHKSGKVYIYSSRGIPRVKIDNKRWFSIDCEIGKLINLFKSSLIDNNSYISDLINELIAAVYSNNYSNLNKDIADVLLITLLMCYNKESLMDEYMLTQTSFIDASKFTIKHDGYNDNYKEFARNFFDKYDLFFKDYKCKDSYEEEWLPIMGDADRHKGKLTYIYDVSNMAYDETTKKHIPTPLFLKSLRDACSHGHIEFKDDKLVFYNDNPKNNVNLKYYMTISKDDFKEFIHSNYFTEGILTSMEEHADRQKGKLYNIEKEESSKSFSNYMQIFKNKFKNLTTEELVLYMYKNNKFSTYLLENPGNEEEFFKYKIGDDYLWELIQFLEGAFEKKIPIDYSTYEDADYRRIIVNYITDGYNYLRDYVYGFLKDSAVLLDDNNKSIQFFSNYYLFLKNLNSVSSKCDSITEEELENVKTLRREWFVSNKFFNLKMNGFFKLFFAVSMQSKNLNEYARIMLVSRFNKTAFSKDIDNPNEDNSLQPKREHYKYSPINIKSIAGVNFMESIITQLGLTIFDNSNVVGDIKLTGNRDEYLKKNIKLTDVLTMYLIDKISGYISLLKSADDISDENIIKLSRYIEDSVKERNLKK